MGTLGGTPGVAAKVTNQGQVVGDSDLEGDSTQHGFSWRNGVLTDMEAFGGNFSTAKWVNESGDVVGYASTEAGLIKAFRWKNGHMSNLGAVDNDLCSAAWNINEAGQLVGDSAPECDFSLEREFLWENGQIFDLNTFVLADSDLYLFEADFINGRGDITGPAVLPNGDVHQYLLLRCDEKEFEVCTESDKYGATSVRKTTPKAYVSKQGISKLLDKNFVSRIHERLRKVRSKSSEERSESRRRTGAHHGQNLISSEVQNSMHLILGLIRGTHGRRV